MTRSLKLGLRADDHSGMSWSAIKGEVHTLLTAVRLNSRWALGERFTKQIPNGVDGPLTARLRSLYEYLCNADLDDLDLLRIISPFIAIVCSPQASGQITSQALCSLHTILLHQFIKDDSKNAQAAISLVVKGIVNCRFEDTRKEGDEVVLVKLLDLTSLSFRCSAAHSLRDKDMRRVIFICYQIGSRNGISEFVRSCADNTLGHVILNMYCSPQQFTCKEGSILEIAMQLLTHLSNPRHGSQSTCMLAISVMNIALEANGQFSRLPSALALIMQHDLCRHLLEASETTNPAMHSLIFRLMLNILRLIKSKVKMQLELFVVSIQLKLVGNTSQVTNCREVALENLLELCREPLLMFDLYAAYDCNIRCDSLLEKMFLAISSAAVSNTTRPVHAVTHLAFECSLVVTETMALRWMIQSHLKKHNMQDLTVDSGIEGRRIQTKTPEQQRRAKRRLAKAVHSFNMGEDWLVQIQQSTLSDTTSANAIACFLYETPGLNKRRIGEFLSKGPRIKFPFNTAVLHMLKGVCVY